MQCLLLVLWRYEAKGVKGNEGKGNHETADILYSVNQTSELTEYLHSLC